MEDCTEGNVVVIKHELTKCEEEDEAKMAWTIPNYTSKLPAQQLHYRPQQQ